MGKSAERLRIVVFCDNQAVVGMVNSLTSSCPNCLHLIRVLVLHGLRFNRRVFAKYVTSKNNFLADALSCLDLSCFRRLGPHMNTFPDGVSMEIWPVNKVWQGLTK